MIVRLAKAGYRVCALEIEQPTTIRRTVAFSEAVYTGEVALETVVCRRAESDQEAKTLLDQGIVALMVDPSASMIERLRPFAVVDAIIAKKNLGTHKGMAPLVIALGPGFEAGVDCDYVIETKRGMTSGRSSVGDSPNRIPEFRGRSAALLRNEFCILRAQARLSAIRRSVTWSNRAT